MTRKAAGNPPLIEPLVPTMSPKRQLLLLIGALCALWACSDARRSDKAATPAAPEPDPEQIAFEALVDFEDLARAEADFAALPPSSTSMGPDPTAIAALPGGRAIVALRGASALLIVDPKGAPLHRAGTVDLPTSLVVRAGEVFVGAEGASALGHHRIEGDTLVRLDDIPLDGALSPRAIGAGDEGPIYFADEATGRIEALIKGSGEGILGAWRRAPVGRCNGPVQLARVGARLIVNCPLDHALLIHALDGEGLAVGQPARIEHEGPIWGFAAAEGPDGLLIAAGGVEDRALDRSDGSFGYIDSFVFLYGLDAQSGQPARRGIVNVSERGIITPRWLSIKPAESGCEVIAAGYGGDALATIRFSGDDSPEIKARPAPAGIAAMAPAGPGRWIAANPLLDALIRFEADGTHAIVPLKGGPRRDPEVLLGEALFFTRLMAPWNDSTGRGSRFTCETCHFEGYGDGRVHFTGRGAVHATTKPLLGLGSNRPFFTRALDRTMAQMVWNEFKVANKNNGRDPWFALDKADFPWLAAVEGLPERLDPVTLRRALMKFLIAFTHRPNPAARGRDRFNEVDRQGAALFRDRCAACHDARLVADDPGSSVPFEAWEARVLSPQGPITWASDAYQKTGVEPYVHDEGARPPALRRLAKKRPYFTNGSAPDLDAVLKEAAFEGERFWHAAPSKATVTRLTEGERAALRAFLDLL